MNQSASSILLLLSFSVGVAMIGLGIIWPLIPVYAVELGAGGFIVGIIIASFNIARTVFSPFTGRISDRRGRKNFIVVGLIFYAIISFFYTFANDSQSLIIIRFAHGVASLLVVPIAMALAVDIAPKNQLGLYMGTINLALMLGLGIGPVLGGIIREHFGMNTAFYSMGALAVLTCVIVILFLPSDRAMNIAEKNKGTTSLKKILSHRVVWGILLMRFFAASGQGAVYSFLPVLAMQLDLTSSQVGLILTSNILLIALLQRSSGRLSDRVNPKYLLVTGMFASGLTVLGMPFMEGFIMILLLNILMGMANGLMMPGGLVISGQLGRTMGTASLMSVNDGAWSLGMIISPILSGAILDLWGLPYIFVIGSVLILAGSVAVAVLLKGYQHSVE